MAGDPQPLIVRPRLARALALAGTFLAVSALVLPSAAAASSSGTKLLDEAGAAAAKQGSFHWVSVAVEPTSASPNAPKVTETIKSDASVSGGGQTLTIQEHSGSGTESIDYVAKKKTAYFKGNAFALENFNGFPAARAKHFANVWISVPSTNSYFASLANGLTPETAALQLAMTAPKLLTPERFDGQSVNVVESTETEGSVTGTVKLYVKAKGTPLPIEQVSTSKLGHATLSFGSWGEKVHVSAPSQSVSISLV